MRKTTLSATMLTHLTQDIIDAGLPLIKRWGCVIQEDALTRAGHKAHRDEVQWKDVKYGWEQALGIKLKTVSARLFLDCALGVYDSNISVTKAVIQQLQRQHGGTTAGYALPSWQRDHTRRRIVAQQHTGDGLYQSAQALEANINTPTQLELPSE